VGRNSLFELGRVTVAEYGLRSKRIPSSVRLWLSLICPSPTHSLHARHRGDDRRGTWGQRFLYGGPGLDGACHFHRCNGLVDIQLNVGYFGGYARACGRRSSPFARQGGLLAGDGRTDRGRGRGPAAGEVLKLVYSLQSAQCVACQQHGDICKPAQHSGAAADLDVPGVARGPRALYVSRPPFLVLPRTGSTVEAYDTLASASRGAAGPEECATTTSAGHTGSAGSAGEIDSGRLLNTAGAGPGQGPAMTTHSARTARMRGTRPPVRRF